ncbi:MAG: hypothetical protein JWM41_1688 [Gemmatimonadetes bacterium]|nr:hypothetical protein [Gemmatimonadota bacterium]
MPHRQERETLMRKFRSIGLLAAAVGAAACGSDNTSPGSGSVTLQLTDAAFSVDSVKSADMFVVRVDGRVADADSAAAAKGATDDSANTDGWVTLARPNAAINLLALQNGVATTIGQSSLPAGTYQSFRIIVDPTKSSITLKDGKVLSGTSSPSIVFPSGARSGIKISMSQPLTIAAGQSTTLLVDFDLANSFVLRGNSLSQNGLLFKPVVRATVKAP